MKVDEKEAMHDHGIINMYGFTDGLKEA